MRKSMANDPVAPVLWEPYFAALDRRVGKVLHEIRVCMNKTDEYVKNMIEQIADMPPELRGDFNSNDSDKFHWSDTIMQTFSNLSLTSD